jgi:hypothetical protein
LAHCYYSYGGFNDCVPLFPKACISYLLVANQNLQGGWLG